MPKNQTEIAELEALARFRQPTRCRDPKRPQPKQTCPCGGMLTRDGCVVCRAREHLENERWNALQRWRSQSGTR